MKIWGSWVGVMLILAGACSLMWLCLPAKVVETEVKIPAELLLLPDSDAERPISIPGKFSIRLGAPKRLWVGNTAKIMLTLERTGDGETGEGMNVYQFYNVVAEARLDMGRLTAGEGEVIQKPLVEGRGTSFSWNVRSDTQGQFNGAVWLYFIFVPREGGEAIENLVFTYPVEMPIEWVMGVSIHTARAVLVIFIAIGGVLLGATMRKYTKQGRVRKRL